MSAESTHHLHTHPHLLVVPHRHNSYQPHLLRAKGMAVLFFIVAGLLGIGALQQNVGVLGTTSTISQQQLLTATNNERSLAGTRALTLNTKLTRAAAMKAADMFKQQYWAHVSPSGDTPWTWLKKSGYSYNYAGENLARGYRTSAAVVAAWMNSKGHRENMLRSEYTHVGFAVGKGTLRGEKTTLVVAEYGAPSSSNVLVATFAPELHGTMGLLTRIGVALQSLDSATLGALGLLGVGILVGLVAHAYRAKLPKSWQKSWKRHHGLYKAVAMAGCVIVILLVYGSGQI
ncbi:hypothetical protein KBD87_02110 [Candidatus Saccharibacteria bacterium]|nr:hypothetical protein [Candidatus Saccharibacteria bacterium]